MVFAKILVLDLDETLVHANDEPKLPRPAEFRVGPYGVLRRPGVEAFLEFALTHFEHVGVWTASTLSYALPVLDHIVERERLAFAWGCERCTYRMQLLERYLRSIGDVDNVRTLEKRGWRARV